MLAYLRGEDENKEDKVDPRTKILDKTPIKDKINSESKTIKPLETESTDGGGVKLKLGNKKGSETELKDDGE